jgi:hypothetical protein
MSVSSFIDNYAIRHFERTGTAPQREAGRLTFGGLPEYDIIYHGEDFALPKQKATFSPSGFRKSAGNELLPAPRDYVPLKSAQMGSHADGAALFNAGVNGPIPKLNVPDVRANLPDESKFIEEHFPGVPPEIMYKKGIRPSYPPRPIKFDDVNTGGAMPFKYDAEPEKMPVRTTNYNLGMDELREMMRR